MTFDIIFKAGEMMNGILLVNKEKGLTSHQVVVRLRNYFKIKQIGHTGTLDPNAEGLLQILIGKATKLNLYLETSPKTYLATLKLGIKTDTEDIWGTIIAEKQSTKLDKKQVELVLKSFLGKSHQLPPMYSAVKIAGKKLYEYARKAEMVKREKREIEIYQIDLVDLKEDEITFSVSCSSGTYIRTLCQDIALKLDNYGTMSSLKRLQIANYKVEAAYNLSDITSGKYHLISNGDALKHYQWYEISDKSTIINGKPINLNSDEELVLITYDNEPLAFYKKVADNRYHAQRGLW